MASTTLPIPLLDLLSNAVIIDHVVPHLSLPAVLALSRVSRSFQHLLWTTPRVWRRLELSQCKGAYIPQSQPIDSGGKHWRSERMDESLTEDEFYSGPIRGIFSKLSRKGVLRHVQILVLDRLSVTMELVSEIIQSDQFSVRILSIIDCYNINQRKLQALLRYVCRPTRPEGSPRLKGLYFFGPGRALRTRRRDELRRLEKPPFDVGEGVTRSEGAQLGSAPKHQGTVGYGMHESEYWNASVAPLWNSVQIKGFAGWEQTLLESKGIISFDATLCQSVYHDPVFHQRFPDLPHSSQNRPFATIPLGPKGCESCERAPQFEDGPPTLGVSPVEDFPLLSPPPHTASLTEATSPIPPTKQQPRLIMSCKECLAQRWCEQCSRWWCHDCYPKSAPGSNRNYEIAPDGGMEFGAVITPKQNIKVFNGLCTQFCLVGEMMAGGGEGGMWG